MAWDSTYLKNSFYNLLGIDGARADAGRVQQVERLRTAMLVCLDDLNGNEVSALDWRITYAKDVQALWYFRSDLMGVLASRKGEAAAQNQLGLITPLFRGLVPKGLMSRPSPLHS